jgi:hypothetical protein
VGGDFGTTASGTWKLRDEKRKTNYKISVGARAAFYNRDGEFKIVE